MRYKKLVAVEIILIFASVLIFRGLWMLLDRIPLMNGNPALLVSLVLGVAVSAPALRYLVKNYKKYSDSA